MSADVPIGTGTSAASKDKLGRMLDGFTDFEGIMKDATRVWLCFTVLSSGFHDALKMQQRRDLDQQKLEDLKREMGGLEKDFSTEVQRRGELSTSLHSVSCDCA